MPIKRSVREVVLRRAGYRCEYCHLPQFATRAPFHVDHIIARQHGGKGNLSNLALACSLCNFHKGPNIAGIDPDTRQPVVLFNPRADRWEDHLRRTGARIRGVTASGRATVSIFDMNGLDRMMLRTSLIEEGAIPPREP